MAIKRRTKLDIQCEGVCEKKPQTVDVVPSMWSRLKVLPATQEKGKKPEYLVMTLCGGCTIKAITLLKNNGFKFTSVGFGEGNNVR